MPQNLENQIQELIQKQKCPFCQKQVQESKLAGFSHQKDHVFFLKKPICQDCWTKKSDLIKSNSQNFSSLEQIKNTNQKLQNWIKSSKEKQSFVGDQKQTKNQPKNNSQEDW